MILRPFLSPMLILPLCLLLFAFRQGDVVELQKYLNGRTHAQFTGKKNIKFLVPKKTKGEVLEVHRFPSGNAGVKIRVMGGNYDSQEVWVFHDRKEATLKLFKSVEMKEETKKVEEAKALETQVQVVGFQDRKPEEYPDMVSLIHVVTNVNHGVLEPTEAEIADCISFYKEQQQREAIEQTMSDGSANDPKPTADGATATWETSDFESQRLGEAVEIDASFPADADPEKSITTLDDGIPAVYKQILFPSRDATTETVFCRKTTSEKDPGLSYCVNPEEVREFSLNNNTVNKMNPGGGNVRREFTFSARQEARQELGLLVYEWGSPSDGENDSHWSMMTEILFFPRKVQPAVRTINEGKTYEVTIPNGEKILFDAKTKEIIGGALAETAPIDTSTNRQTRKFAGLKYTGKGIMVRSDQRGDSPRSAKVWGINKSSTVTWGNKTCRVPNGEIWQQNAQGEGSNNLHTSDETFYAALKKRCGWNVSAQDFE